MFIQLFRMTCRRRFFLFTAVMVLVVVYQLVQNLFTAYAVLPNGESLLALDMPPLFIAATTIGGSDTFALLLPFAVFADSAWCLKSGYLSLIVGKRTSPVRVSLTYMAALIAATALSFVLVSLVIIVICMFVCTGSFEADYLRTLCTAAPDYAPTLSLGAAGNTGLILLQLVVCLAMATSTGFVALAFPRPAAAVVLWPALWAITQHTPIGSALWSCTLPSTWAPPEFLGFFPGIPGEVGLVGPYLRDVALTAMALNAVCLGAAVLVHGNVAKERRWMPWRKRCA